MFGRKKSRADEGDAPEARTTDAPGQTAGLPSPPPFGEGPAAVAPPSTPFPNTAAARQSAGDGGGRDDDDAAGAGAEQRWASAPVGQTTGVSSAYPATPGGPAASSNPAGAWASQVRSMTLANQAPVDREQQAGTAVETTLTASTERAPGGPVGQPASTHDGVSAAPVAPPVEEPTRAEVVTPSPVALAPVAPVGGVLTGDAQPHVESSGAGTIRATSTGVVLTGSASVSAAPAETTGLSAQVSGTQSTEEAPAAEITESWDDRSATHDRQDGDAPVSPDSNLDLDPDDRRRAALVESLPEASDDTPLMAQLQQDARRRIELRGRRFPRPPSTRVVTVANQKGGVGKTTTTVNLAAALAQAGLNVLVLDNDPQGNASTAIGIEHRSGTPSIYEVLVDGAPMSEAVQESPDIPNLFCLPATIDLSGAEIELVSMVARETRLRNALDTYLAWRIETGQEPIDYVFVDCPPSLGLLTVNAFVVAREVLIPIQCEYYALEGLSQLLKTIELIQAHLNPNLHVSTILLTMYDARTNLAQQVANEVRTHFPELTLRTTVPRSVRISEAPSYGQTVMTYDPGSTGALAYLEAAREVAERGAAPADKTTNATATARDDRVGVPSDQTTHEQSAAMAAHQEEQ